jgi:ABC-2 type transport system permease protein
MLADIKTVFWKEIKEIMHLYKGSRGSMFGLIFAIGLLGIFMPLKAGGDWVDSALPLVFSVLVPLMTVLMVSAESFAGERERKTLETLLASRLPDNAILFGKILALVAFPWSMILVLMLLSLVTVNIAQAGSGGLLFFPPAVCLGILLFPVLSACFAVGIGVLVSLRAATVRQAQQAMSIMIIPIFVLPGLILPALPHKWREPLFAFFKNIDYNLLLINITLLIVVIDILLILAAVARFKRSKLVLD